MTNILFLINTWLDSSSPVGEQIYLLTDLGTAPHIHLVRHLAAQVIGLLCTDLTVTRRRRGIATHPVEA